MRQFNLKSIISLLSLVALSLPAFGATRFDYIIGKKLDIDNVRVDGNVISTLNTNGDLTLTPNGTGNIIFSPLTATTVPYIDASKKLISSAVTPTELGYVSGVTSAVQTQLDAKIAKTTATTKGDIFVATGSATVVRQAIGSDAQILTADSAQTNGLKWATATAAPSAASEMSNCSISVGVSASDMTISLKDSGGSAPSAGSQCKIGFRNPTASTGSYTQVATSSLIDMIVSNGSAVGCTATVPCTLLVYAVNNAGTVVLGVINDRPLDEGVTQSSTAEGGAGGADSAGVLYTTAAQSSKAVRLLGRIVITPAAAFAWTNVVSTVSNWPFYKDPYVRTGTVQCFSSSSITSQGSDGNGWIQSIGNVSGSACSLTFRSGAFTSTPVCFISDVQTGSTNSTLGIAASSATAGAIHCNVPSTGGSCSIFTVNVMCVGF